MILSTSSIPGHCSITSFSSSGCSPNRECFSQSSTCAAVALMHRSTNFLTLWGPAHNFTNNLLGCTRSAVTQLLRYYEPLRHPTQPGPPLTSCQLIREPRSPLGFPVLRLVSSACMPSPLPRQVDGLFRSYDFHHRRPSPITRWVGSCITCFEACSAFTHVMACTLAESPSDPLHRKLRQLRCLRRRFDCYRVERTSSRAGVAPAEVQRLSRRTVSAN